MSQKQQNVELEQVEMPQVEPVSQEVMEQSEIRLLNPKQQRFVHLYLSGNYRIRDIATLLNMSEQGIYLWLRDPKVKSIITEFQKEEDDIIKQGLKALQMKAMYKMSELIDSKMDAIAYQAARDILDRGGKRAPTKQEVSVEVRTFEQQLKEVMETSRAVDVEYESSDE